MKFKNKMRKNLFELSLRVMRHPLWTKCPTVSSRRLGRSLIRHNISRKNFIIKIFGDQKKKEYQIQKVKTEMKIKRHKDDIELNNTIIFEIRNARTNIRLNGYFIRSDINDRHPFGRHCDDISETFKFGDYSKGSKRFSDFHLN